MPSARGKRACPAPEGGSLLRSKRAARVAATGGAPRRPWRVFEAHKRTAVGRMSVWRAAVTRAGRVYTTWGLLGGKTQVTDIQTTEGKCGRDPGQQAEMETRTRWRRRIDGSGYSDGPPPKTTAPVPAVGAAYAGGATALLPMLLHPYEKYRARLEKRCDVVFRQPKLDGVRAPMHPASGTMLSRQRKPFANPLVHIMSQAPELAAKLATLVPDVSAVFLDGELFAPPPSNFQHIVGAVRRASDATAKPGALRGADVDFYVYDLFDRSRPELPFEERLEILRDLLQDGCGRQRFPHVSLVPTDRGPSDAASLKRFHDEWVGRGFEGAVYRAPDGVYKEDGRSSEVLKHKAFFQEEFRVVGVVPKQGEEHLAGAVELEVASGATKGARFRAGLAMDREQKRDILARRDELVGEWGTVTFFERTPDGIPRFPILRGFRGKRGKL